MFVSWSLIVWTYWPRRLKASEPGNRQGTALLGPFPGLGGDQARTGDVGTKARCLFPMVEAPG